MGDLRGDSDSNLDFSDILSEIELAQMKETLAESFRNKEPWWVKVAGSFENDPTFDEAARLGQEWRKSAE